ncbi:MAG: nucleoside kinase [Oscillospiraceae bacterium]|jgi:uridine kinase|nr:nucleoside kinase [Oscillospiraceae bacterium]
MAAIHNDLMYINDLARTSPETLIEKSEARFRGLIDAAAQRVLRVHGHKMILLAGPSASGKTTTAGKISEALRREGVESVRISLDDFYRDKDDVPLLPDGSRDLESIHALELPLLTKTLRDLMERGEGELPRYDFGAGRRLQGEPLRLPAEGMLIVEGLHAINPLIMEGLGAQTERVTRIYISVSSRIYGEKQDIVLNKRNLRLVRRTLRDLQFRGSGAAETLGMWSAVTAGEEAFLSPCKPYADLLINSVHVYEPCVFRHRALPLLEEIPSGSPAAAEARKLAKALRQFEPLAETLVPADSLLREFLGNR